MRLPMKLIAKRILIVLVGIFLALGTGEVYLRVFSPQKTVGALTAPYLYECYEKGEYYWVRLKPNQNCKFSSKSQVFRDFTVKTNAQGILEEAVGPESASTKRLLFLGDSFTFGLGVGTDKAFPALSGKLLQQSLTDARIEVLNAALPATGPGFDYLFLKNDGLNLKPDVVVVGFFMQNDIPDQLSTVWEDLDAQGLPRRIESKTAYIGPNGMMLSKKITPKFQTPFLKHSHLFALLVDNFWKEESQDNKPSLSPITPEACLYKKNCHDLDEVKQRVKKLFLGMKALTDKEKTKLLVAFIPAEFQITYKTNARRFSNIPIPLLPSDKEYPYQEFSQFFKENNIDYLDMRAELRKEDKSLYINYDGHFNEDGHKITAQVLAQKLITYFKTEAEATKSAEAYKPEDML